MGPAPVGTTDRVLKQLDEMRQSVDGHKVCVLSAEKSVQKMAWMVKLILVLVGIVTVVSLSEGTIMLIGMLR